jgi:hypothetical protein
MIARSFAPLLILTGIVATGCKDRSTTPPAGTATAGSGNGGVTAGPEEDDGSASTAPGNRDRLGSPAPLKQLLIRLGKPKLNGPLSVSVDYEIVAGRSAPGRVMLVFIYTDGFDNRELDVTGLAPGTKRTVTIQLQKNVAVNFGQIDFWAGSAGGSAIVGSSERISNVVNLVVK